MNRIATASISIVAMLAASAVPPAEAQPMPGQYGAPSYSVPRGDVAAGRKLAGAKCASCHGPGGNSPMTQYPKLAGQNPAYLYSQLLAFKTGVRPSPVMVQALAGLSRADMTDLAQFYSEQAMRPDQLTNRDLASIGERIFFSRGAAGAPPCATCHTANGGGMPMMGMMGRGSVGPVPNLYGQHAAYSLAQLNRYASGARPDGVMNRIAATLSESERKAVAEYLSGPP